MKRVKPTQWVGLMRCIRKTAPREERPRRGGDLEVRVEAGAAAGGWHIKPTQWVGLMRCIRLGPHRERSGPAGAATSSSDHASGSEVRVDAGAAAGGWQTAK